MAMKKAKKNRANPILFVTILALLGCLAQLPPTNHRQWLAQYGQFMEEVRSNHDSPNWCWEKADQRFLLLSETHSERFRADLALAERLLVEGYAVEYRLLRARGMLRGTTERILDAVRINDSREIQP